MIFAIKQNSREKNLLTFPDFTAPSQKQTFDKLNYSVKN